MKAFRNIRLVTKDDVVSGRAVLFDEKITDIVDEENIPQDAEVIDGEGKFLVPGFIDVHVHGCCGCDVMDDEEEALENIVKGVVKTGVTAFLPTTMTMDMERVERSLKRIRMYMGKSEYAEVLGCHLEGPFISRKYKGAQNEEYIIEPGFEKIKPYLDVIRIVTIAPEVEGSIEFIKKCAENNIIVSIGHSNATFDEAMAAIEAGATHTTHTFNAMTPLNHRNPGIVGAAMVSDVICELICDNLHVHPAVQLVLLKTKGKEKIVLITDAMRACMLKDGEYDLGGQMVYVRGNEARLNDGTIAGSVLTLNNGIKNFRNNTGVKIWEAVNMASLNPAIHLGIEDRKGSIEKNKDADLVLLDDDFNVIMTYARGKRVF